MKPGIQKPETHNPTTNNRKPETRKPEVETRNPEHPKPGLTDGLFSRVVQIPQLSGICYKFVTFLGVGGSVYLLSVHRGFITLRTGDA